MAEKVKNNHRDYKLIILLLLSATVVRGDNQVQTLMSLFEEGLVNTSENLFNLRQLYFNPFKYSPASVCLYVSVTVDNITDSSPFYCTEAFQCFDFSWTFESMYVLQLSSDDSQSGTLQLNDLLTSLGITVFFAFDPTFYTIMKVLSSPAILLHSDNSYYFNNYAEINIHLREQLETMPCWDDVDEALRLVLVWVSCKFNSNQCHGHYKN